MILKNILSLSIITILLMGCGQIQRIMDGTEKLPDQIAETNKGMRDTNESIRQQKIGVALSEMQKKSNREYLTPIPGDMIPFGKIMAEALTPDEALLFIKDYFKKINEENFENRYPRVDSLTPEGQTLLASFDHDKIADLMMITIVAGYLPDSTLNQMILIEAEQGAYREILYQTLMLRVSFNNDLMLNAGVMGEKLSTLGKIKKAIEYNSKVEFVARLNFVDQVELKITGFSVPAMNETISKKFDKGLALKNWNRIYSAAQKDFKVQSFAANETEKNQSVDAQKIQHAQLMTELQSFIQAWGQNPLTLQ